jgi:hypothetical protein
MNRSPFANQLLAISATKLLLGFVFLSGFSCTVKAQAQPYSRSGLPDNPVPNVLVLDKNDPSESPKTATAIHSTLRADKFTVTTKVWIASSLAVYAAAALDMHATEETAQQVKAFHRHYPWFPADYSFEADPFARPLLKLPAPAYYVCGVALATGVNWASLRMSQSQRFRKVWWLPQALSVAGNTHGYLSYQ